MAGDVANIKACKPLKLHCGLTGKKHAVCHYAYTQRQVQTNNLTKNEKIKS